MIFSSRRRAEAMDGAPFLIRAAEGKARPPASKAPEAAADWRKRTDTDGTERRARQAKRDNELL